MTLEQFLQTADADHATALQQAREYETTQGRFITSNTLTVYVVQLSLYSVLADIANTTEHPARDMCMAVIDRLRGVSDFNFITGTPMGDANFALLDALITHLSDHTAALNQLKAAVTAYCNQSVKPFANATLHDVLVARDAVTLKPVVMAGGYVTVTTSADCETHRPRLVAFNPRTGKHQRINNFDTVSTAGVYECAVPPLWYGYDLFVDDAYGVM